MNVKQLTRSLITIMMLTLLSAMSFAGERVVWDKTPINVTLKPGKEKMVVFPSDSVRVKIPPSIQESLNTLSNNGVIYWKASEEFESQRILVQDKHTHQIIVINLAADNKTGNSDKLTVMLGEPESESENTHSSSIKRTVPPHLGYDVLTRTAAKHLYAPSRLVEIPKGMVRVQVARKKDTHMLRGSIVEMEPVISFNNHGIYVTAVKLTNLQNEKVILDPRNIRGNWLAATFQHAIIGSSGEDTDTTSLYLISRRPFWESY